MTKETILVRKSEIYAADMNGETVMMDPTAGKYYNIGEVGGRIWELLEKPTCVSELLRILTEEYEVSPAQCEEDTLPFLQDLTDKGLLCVQ